MSVTNPKAVAAAVPLPQQSTAVDTDRRSEGLVSESSFGLSLENCVENDEQKPEQGMEANSMYLNLLRAFLGAGILMIPKTLQENMSLDRVFSF